MGLFNLLNLRSEAKEIINEIERNAIWMERKIDIASFNQARIHWHQCRENFIKLCKLLEKSNGAAIGPYSYRGETMLGPKLANKLTDYLEDTNRIISRFGQ
ncbi:MAG: hypothetical protein K2K97_09860 [Muribaculaceae bacterium]|nr:hypothetical protein [Muribaculaceae bacterium]